MLVSGSGRRAGGMHLHIAGRDEPHACQFGAPLARQRGYRAAGGHSGADGVALLPNGRVVPRRKPQIVSALPLKAYDLAVLKMGQMCLVARERHGSFAGSVMSGDASPQRCYW